MRSCKTQRALGQVGERAARSGPAVRLDTVQGPKPEGHSVLTSAHRRAHSAKQSAPEGRRERDRLDVKAAAEADETDGSKHEHRRQHHAAAHVRVRTCASMCAHAAHAVAPCTIHLDVHEHLAREYVFHLCGNACVIDHTVPQSATRRHYANCRASQWPPELNSCACDTMRYDAIRCDTMRWVTVGLSIS
jgi:hypothetical protein